VGRSHQSEHAQHESAIHKCFLLIPQQYEDWPCSASQSEKRSVEKGKRQDRNREDFRKKDRSDGNGSTITFQNQKSPYIMLDELLSRRRL